MLKNLLLLTVSTSFVAILLIANSAIALTLPAHSLTQTSALSLNIVSPSLQLSHNHTLPNHLGCSCTLCSQGVKQI